jgi:hypothetical protein
MAEVSERDRIRLVLAVERDVDETELDAITTELRERVLEVFEVHGVAGVLDPSPERDVKAGDMFLPGELDVLVPLTAVALHQVFSTIRTYIRERPVTGVRISRDRKGNINELEITGHTRDVDALVRRFLDAPQGREHERGD